MAEEKKSLSLNIIKYELLHPEALAPVQQHQGDAGWDVHSLEDVCIDPGENKKVKTGVRIEIPFGHYIQIAPRSGLSLACKLMIMGGVIDRSYGGEISVVLYNAGRESVFLKKHTRVAQMLIVKIAEPASMVPARLASKQTSRGDKGFGVGSGLF